jgi:hypothetical protein
MGKLSDTPSDKRNQNGGKRPGAGQPMKSNVEMHARLHPQVKAKLNRFAESNGLRKGAWGAIITKIVDSLDLPEPEYLRLARQVQSVAKSG